jgi:hypothetical protein
VPGVRLDEGAQGTCHLKSGFEPIALFAPRWQGLNLLHRWRKCTCSGLAGFSLWGAPPTIVKTQISYSVSCYAQQFNSSFREHAQKDLHCSRCLLPNGTVRPTIRRRISSSSVRSIDATRSRQRISINWGRVVRGQPWAGMATWNPFWMIGKVGPTAGHWAVASTPSTSIPACGSGARNLTARSRGG